MKKHNCCFAGCKYRHLSLICVLDHMAKDHKLKINNRAIYVRQVSGEAIEDVSQEKHDD